VNELPNTIVCWKLKRNLGKRRVLDFQLKNSVSNKEYALSFAHIPSFSIPILSFKNRVGKINHLPPAVTSYFIFAKC
jgi:hypothetical protein